MSQYKYTKNDGAPDALPKAVWAREAVVHGKMPGKGGTTLEYAPGDFVYKKAVNVEQYERMAGAEFLAAYTRMP